MSDLKQKMHHCENCNAVFTDVTPLPKEAVCSKCGKRPFRLSGFNSMTHLAAVEDDDKSHGVPGQDLADFVSMQKVRRKRQARMAIYLWIGLLLVGTSVAVYNQQVVDDLVDTNDFLRESLEEQEKLHVASSDAFEVSSAFFNSTDGNEKSQYIVGGVSRLLLLKSQHENVLAFKPSMPMVLLKSNFSEDGLYPRIEQIFKDTSGNKVEVVCWNMPEGWKLDWEHYVRFSHNDWENFLAKPKEGNVKEFKLYVRKRHVGSVGDRKALQLVFYRPRAANTSRLREAAQLELESDSPIYDQLNEAFEELEKTESERLIGHTDPPGFLRVRGSFSFEPNGDKKLELKLKSIAALHWMAFDPEVNKGE